MIDFYVLDLSSFKDMSVYIRLEKPHLSLKDIEMRWYWALCIGSISLSISMVYEPTQPLPATSKYKGQASYGWEWRCSWCRSPLNWEQSWDSQELNHSIKYLWKLMLGLCPWIKNKQMKNSTETSFMCFVPFFFCFRLSCFIFFFFN